MPDAAEKPKSSPLRFQYIHPADLLTDRLRGALQDASQALWASKEFYELDWYEAENGQMMTTKLRADAYCNPRDEKYFWNAWHSLERAQFSAVGISEWLRWGMADRAGTFETDLRRVLSALHTHAMNLPALVCYPYLKNVLIRWEGNLQKGWDLLGELGHVSIEVRDPVEWYESLRETLSKIKALRDACCDYYEVAKDVQADVTSQFDALVSAVIPVTDQLRRVGPRLCHAYDDREDVSGLVSHFAESLYSDVWNLPTWRLRLASSAEEQERLMKEPPALLSNVWSLVFRLGDLVHDLLGVCPDEIKKPPNGSPVSGRAQLPADDFAVLTVLSEAERLLHQHEIGARTHDTCVERNLDRSSLVPILARLETKKLVHRPEGKRMGYGITAEGRAAISAGAT